MRLLFVVHGFPPQASAGTENYVRALAGAIRRGGDEVTVLTREFDPARRDFAVRRERKDGLDLVWVNNGFRDCRSLEDTYLSPQVRAIASGLLDELRPEVAHLHHLTGLSTDLVFELAERGVPTLFTLNDFWMVCQRGQLLDLELRRCAGPSPAGCARCLHADEAGAERRLRHIRHVLEQVTLFLCPSQTVRKQFAAFGVAERRLCIQEQGIDLAPFAVRPPNETGTLRVTFAGSLMTSKAPHLLFEAARRLPVDRVRVVLAGGIVPYHGDDSYRQVLEGSRAGSPAVWLGPLAHDRVAELLLRTDVLVVPSIWVENSPFVIKEAWAAGAVVVASDLGGMAELVRHEENGLLFAPGDAESLRRALERLAGEPGLLARLRERIPAVRSIDDDAEEARQIYRRLGELRASASSASPVRAPGTIRWRAVAARLGARG